MFSLLYYPGILAHPESFVKGYFYDFFLHFYPYCISGDVLLDTDMDPSVLEICFTCHFFVWNILC